MDLPTYLDRARERAGFTSDRQLAVAVGVAQNTLRQYRIGLAAPSPERMLRLAELAEVPAERALVDAFSWRADGPKSRAVMAQIMAMVQGSAAALVLGFMAFSSPASAVTIGHETHGTRYIMERKRRGG